VHSQPKSPRPIGRAAAWLAKQVELGLAGVDLSVPQYRVLGLLDEGSEVASGLAERLAVRPPSITSVVDGLVLRGLVVRQAIEYDRRRIALVLTDEGRQILAAADDAVQERLVAVASCLEGDGISERAIENLSLWHEAVVLHHIAKVPIS
jgi:long-chain acyl-CoA synthetase